MDADQPTDALPPPADPAPEPGPPAGPIRGHSSIASLLPFGVGLPKPRHYRALGRAIWQQREALPAASRLLARGVCEGCALGPRGLADDVLDGVHLCTHRLALLQASSRPSLLPADLLDVARLRRQPQDQLVVLGRLSHPYLYRTGTRGYTRMSWEDALAWLGDQIAATPPERLAFLASGHGPTNETWYALSKVARLLGTNHVDLYARRHHAATAEVLQATLGVGAGTASLSDLIGADLILLLGTDLAQNQPVALRYLHEAKARGARVVSLNPLREPGLDAAWLPTDPVSAVFGSHLLDDAIAVRPGGDAAFLTGVLKALDARGGVDPDWIARHSDGWAALREALAAWPWEALERASGALQRDMAWVAELYARAGTVVSAYGRGLTQGASGRAGLAALVNLHLARGMLGRPKTGLLPLSGQTGIYGAADCGVAPDALPGPRPLSEAAAAELSARWGGPPLPRWPGRSAADLLAQPDGLDVLYTVGGDLRRAFPSDADAAAALARVRVRVHQDVCFNPSMLLDAGEAVLLLPATTRHEQPGGGTSSSVERRVRYSPQTASPRGEARPDWQILLAVGEAARPSLGGALRVADAGALRAEMAALIPRYKGLDRLRRVGGWLQWGGPQLHTGPTFADRPDGRAAFTVHDRFDAPPDLALCVRRGQAHDGAGALAPDEVGLHPLDAASLGLQQGQAVRVQTEHGAWTARLRLLPVARSSLLAGWPACRALLPADPGGPLAVTVTAA